MVTKTPCHVECTCFGKAKLDLGHLYVTESPGSLCFPEVHRVPNEIPKMAAVVISGQGTFTENGVQHTLRHDNVDDETDLCSRRILVRCNLR